MIRPKTFCPLMFFSLAIAAVTSSVSPVDAQVAQDEYNMASGYYARGQWLESIEAFKSVIARFPNTEQAAASHFFLGEAMMQQGDFAGAYQAFQVFLTKLPSHQFAPRAMFRLGETAYRLRQYDRAIRLLELFVLEHPTDRLNEFALPYLGELRIKRNEPQLAQKAYETAILAYPESQLHNKCRLGLARVYQMQGSIELATRLYKSIVSEGDKLLAGEARLQWGILCYGQRDYEMARQLLDEAFVACTDLESKTEATYWLARSETALQNTERAVELFSAAVGQSENETLAAAVYFDGALTAIQAQQPTTAEAWLTQLRDRWPNGQWADDALQLQIDIAQKESRFDDALLMIGQFHENYSDSPLRTKVLESEGRVYYQREEFQKSIDAFQSLLNGVINGGVGIHSGGKQRETWKYLQSLGLIGMDRLAEAETVLGSIDLDGQSEKLRSLVELARATTYSGREKYEHSVAGYRNYLALEPNGTEAFRARAELTIAYARLKQWDLASDAFDDLSQNHEGQQLVLETAKFLAETAFANEQNGYAARWYEYLVRPGNPRELIARGLSGLAWIQMRTNESNHALATFERLVNEYPDTKFAAEAAMARAKFLDDSEQYEEASKMYGFLIDKFPDSKLKQAAMLRCAYSLQKVGGKTNLLQAQNLLADYIQLPGNPPAMDEALYQLGWVYHDLSLAPHGIETFKQLVKEHPNSKYWPDAAFRLVQNYIQKTDLDAAQPLIEKLLNPKTPTEILSRVVFLNGQIAAENNEWESVTLSMRTLVAQATDRGLQATGNYWLAESLYRQGEFAEAGDLFGGLVEETDELDESLTPWIYLRAAQCRGKLDDWTEAKSIAKTASKIYPDFKTAYEYDFIIGRALAAKGKFNNAIVALRRVVDSPTGGSTETAAIAQWRIGEAYFHQEKYEKAIRAYYRVDALFGYQKWRAAALMQAGKCQEHLGNWKHAARLYQQLLTNFPDSEFRQAAEERLRLASRQAHHETNSIKRKIP